MLTLVTGGTGFLGGHVARRLMRDGHRVRVLVRPGRAREANLDGVEWSEGDLRDEGSLRRACAGAERLVHCAALGGGWSRRNLEQRRTNVEGTSALYRAALVAKIQRIVHVSSVAAVACSRRPEVFDESARWNLDEVGLHYAFTKKEGEERAFVAARGGMPIVVVNPGAIFGPRSDGRAHSSLLRKVARGEARWVPRGGLSVTDVEDVAAGAIAALERGRVGERYILGGHNVEWRAFYELAAKLAGARAGFRTIPDAAARALLVPATLLDWLRLSRPPWAPERVKPWGWFVWVDSRKAAQELGYRVRPLEEIVRRSLP